MLHFHSITTIYVIFYNHTSGNNNSNVPFSCDFGDLETEVHGVQIGWLPLEDIVTPPGFVRLRMGGRRKEEDLGD